MTTIDDMVQGTGFEGFFATQWCWRRFCHYYPENIVPTKNIYHEYCCSDRLTFKNINQFIEGAKQILLDIGFIKGRVVYMSRQVKLNVFYLSVYFNPPRTSYFLLFSDFIYHMVPRVKLLYIILRTFFDSSICTIPSTRFKQRSGRGQ